MTSRRQQLYLELSSKAALATRRHRSPSSSSYSRDHHQQQQNNIPRSAVFSRIAYISQIISFFGPADALFLASLRRLNTDWLEAVERYSPLWSTIVDCTKGTELGEHMRERVPQSAGRIVVCRDEGINNSYIVRFIKRVFNTTHDSSWMVRLLHERGMDLATWFEFEFEHCRRVGDIESNSRQDKALAPPFGAAAMNLNFALMETLFGIDPQLMHWAFLRHSWCHPRHYDLHVPLLHAAVYMCKFKKCERLFNFLVEHNAQDTAIFNWSGAENVRDYLGTFGLRTEADFELQFYLEFEADQLDDTALHFAAQDPELHHTALQLIERDVSRDVLNVSSIVFYDMFIACPRTPLSIVVGRAVSANAGGAEETQAMEVVRALLDAGARVQVHSSGDGRSIRPDPFSAALQACRFAAPTKKLPFAERLLLLLLIHGADVNCRGRVHACDDGWCTARDPDDWRIDDDKACSECDPMCPLATLSVFDNVYHGSKPFPIDLPLDHLCLRMMRLLLDRGAKWRTEDGHLPEPTLLAAAAGDADLLVRLCNEAGCNPRREFLVSQPDGGYAEVSHQHKQFPRRGMTPLSVAISRGHFNVVRVLLEQFNCDLKVPLKLTPWDEKFYSKRPADFDDEYDDDDDSDADSEVPRYNRDLTKGARKLYNSEIKPNIVEKRGADVERKISNALVKSDFKFLQFVHVVAPKQKRNMFCRVFASALSDLREREM